MPIIKTLTFGDIHGRDNWRDCNPENYDFIIFVGDYVDSFNKSDIEILNNLQEIIKFKINNRSKVILLLGNHDIQYCLPNNGCSGYRPQMYSYLNRIFGENKELFQVAFQIKGKDKNYLWTHAGVSSKWLELFKEEISLTRAEYRENFESYLNESLASALNETFKYNLDTLFYVDKESGGWESFAGPFWARYSVNQYPLPGFVQIIGHTSLRERNSVVIGDSINHFIDVPNESFELEINT